jgi:hypothetical protein
MTFCKSGYLRMTRMPIVMRTPQRMSKACSTSTLCVPKT